MTVDEARQEYRWATYFLRVWECRSPVRCADCHRRALAADAASITLDHAVAEAAARKSVAW